MKNDQLYGVCHVPDMMEKDNIFKCLISSCLLRNQPGIRIRDVGIRLSSSMILMQGLCWCQEVGSLGRSLS